MRPLQTLYTKDQITYLMRAWECTEPLPKKDQAVYVCFPITGEPFQVDLIVIESTQLKSDAGKKLWRTTSSSSEGREFESRVNEAHVLAYRKNIVENHRLAMLAKHTAFLQTTAH